MKIVKEFILREVVGEWVLVPTGETTREFNGMITLSDTARFIWENLEKADSLDDLVRMLQEEYEVDGETAKRDADGLIRELLKAGFIVCTKEDMTW